MKVKVENNYDPDRPWWADWRIHFEHNGVEWFKYTSSEFSQGSLEGLLNSVIEDTIARTR